MIDKNWLILHVLYVSMRRRGAPGRDERTSEHPRDANPTTRVSRRAEDLRPLLGPTTAQAGPTSPSQFAQSQKRRIRERNGEVLGRIQSHRRINAPSHVLPKWSPSRRGPRRRPTWATRIQSGCWVADTAHLMHPAHLLLPTPDPTPSHLQHYLQPSLIKPQSPLGIRVLINQVRILFFSWHSHVHNKHIH